MALLQQHDARRDILIEPAARRSAAIEARFIPNWGIRNWGRNGAVKPTGLSVCLSVCSRISKTTPPNILKVSVCFIRGRGWDPVWQQQNKLCTSGFVDDVMFPIMSSVAWGTGNIYVSTALEQLVINFQRIRQVSPHCFTLSSHTMPVNCAPNTLAMTTCRALPMIGGLQRAMWVETFDFQIKSIKSNLFAQKTPHLVIASSKNS